MFVERKVLEEKVDIKVPFLSHDHGIVYLPGL